MNSTLLLTRRWFVTIFLLILAMAAYVVGWRVTEINPVKLITSLPKSQKILSDLIHPDLIPQEKIIFIPEPDVGWGGGSLLETNYLL